MKCPYCLEELTEGALVCRACRREVFLVLPLMDKLNALEDRVTALGSAVTHLAPGTGQDIRAEALTQSGGAEVMPPLAIGLLMIVSTTYSSVLAASPFADHSWVRVLLVSLPAIPAVWIGLRTDLSFPAVVRLSLLQCVLAAVLMTLVDLIGPTTSHDPWGLRLFYDIRYFPRLAAYLGLPLAFLFGSGIWFGSWLRTRRQTDAGRMGSLSAQIAGRMLVRTTNESSGFYRQRVQSLSATLQAVGPLFTFAASVIASYFGYLGALSKK